MNPKNFDFASQIISSNYLEISKEGEQQYQKLIRELLTSRSVPLEGLSVRTIKRIILDLSSLDTNNFLNNIGVGEREGRIFSSYVQDRMSGLSHGVGRSGDVSAEQPKAAGSSLIVKLTTRMALQILKASGLTSIKSCLILPLATGMSLGMCFLTLLSQVKTKKVRPRYVIWSRIDQKTCLKSIISFGFEPVIIDCIPDGDQLTTDLESITTKITELGQENIFCIVSTTSCFSPRVPDRVVEVSKICKSNNVPHVINNAYGVQCSTTTSLITQATKQGRVDFIVQSTDKNFMVPVGGSVVASTDKKLIKRLSQTYPGRASIEPILNLFCTFLEMGMNGWKLLLKQRKQNFDYFINQMKDFCLQNDFTILKTPKNKISFAISLEKYSDYIKKNKDVGMIGSMLFRRACTGQRVFKKGIEKQIMEYNFKNYGAHTKNYPREYLTLSCAIGMTKKQINIFIKRLQSVIKEFEK
ncbi:soluble liver antigen/liver pancreas antigen [Anaeramoeba flamelloides]|uniref:O-phosphoseryl-tRNA(Sec) selenium transferase n=1 Tax=Anaeramoeba flamelloides TaxID=1746091 RepID=A0AAV7YNR0_9EUKA|nr:soluble liver antigen/liver pancreas antigen [Anaeramoeba flamelloides]